MGVHRTTSEAARAYAERERILGNDIILLGAASQSLSSIDKPPGHAGKRGPRASDEDALRRSQTGQHIRR